MTTNDLPSWIPLFNLLVSVTALVLVLPGFRYVGMIPAYRSAMGVCLIILAAGAAFQANFLPLWAWVTIGSGGRLLVLALVVTGTALSWP